MIRRAVDRLDPLTLKRRSLRTPDLWAVGVASAIAAGLFMASTRVWPAGPPPAVSHGPRPRIDPGQPGNALYRLEEAGTHELRVEVQPEFLRALDAAIPEGTGCEKVRFKKVPLSGLVIDGQQVLQPAFLRYRGFCAPHWSSRQKSLKITLEGPDVDGYDTFNLNALETDPALFEPWATDLLLRTGGICSRVSLVRLYLNGAYDGLRFLVENLDRDLLRAQDLPQGSLYREITWAYLGHGAAIDRPYRDTAELQAKWKKNAGNRDNWADWQSLQDAIFDSVVHGTDAYKKVVNEDHYINYAAVAAIVGTEHLNNHNIPMYRPARSEAFIPVGYDFATVAAALFANGTPWLPEEIQTPYAPQNWLSGLFWTDPEARQRIHRRMAEILEEADPYGSYQRLIQGLLPRLRPDIEAGLILSRAHAEDDIRQMGEVIRARVRYLERGYLHPRARVSSDWSKRPELQLLIDGLGVYEVAFDLASTPCTPENVDLEVRVHAGARTNVASCRDGRVAALPFLAERHDGSRAALKTHPSYVSRNSLGGILVEVSNPHGLPLERIRIRSLQTGQAFEPTLPWRFDLRRVSEGVVSLGRGADETPRVTRQGTWRTTYDFADFSIHNLDEPGVLSLSVLKGLLRVEQYRVAEENHRDVGPVLCWKDDGVNGCFELTKPFLFSVDPSSLFANAEVGSNTEKVRVVRPESVQGYGRDPDRPERIPAHGLLNITFGPGRWRIAEPLIFDASQMVHFEGGARLEFAEDAYMVIQGPVEFPAEDRPVEFRGIDGKEWGGLVIAGQQQRLEVRHAFFADSNEFSWNGGRMTGALTILDSPESLVHDCRFAQNNGDDALNVRGGFCEVRGNVFYRNRDAMDFDRGRSLAVGNLLVDNRDDGVDIGTAAALVTLRGNVIRGSGDKGVSIGEGSHAELEENLIEKNNVGVAVKDGSAAVLRSNLIFENLVGLSTYNKVTVDGVSRISGDSWLVGNKEPYKAGGLEAHAPEGLRLAPGDGLEMLHLRRHILAQCPACGGEPSE
jgi:hypothetical protein